MNDKTFKALALGMFTVIAGVIAGGVVGVSDKQGAEETLKDLGLSEVVHTGKAGFKSCGRDHFFRDSFSAVNGAGRRIEVVVCRAGFSDVGNVRVIKGP